jgi:hypothetical protein
MHADFEEAHLPLCPILGKTSASDTNKIAALTAGANSVTSSVTPFSPTTAT